MPVKNLKTCFQVRSGQSWVRFFSSLPILNSQIRITFSTLELARASVSKRFDRQSCHSSQLLPVIKIKTNCMCSHIIFNAGGDVFNQFHINIPSFWCIICLRRCSDHKGHQKNIGGSTVATYPLPLLPLIGAKETFWVMISLCTYFKWNEL